MIHDMQIERVPPGRYRVTLQNGERVGPWRDPECSAARNALPVNRARTCAGAPHGMAVESDTMRTWRGTVRSMVGSVGWFAKRSVTESDNDGTPRFRKYKPIPDLDRTFRLPPGRFLAIGTRANA